MGTKKINCKNKNVLVIGDTHLPFIHPDAHIWLKAIKEKYLTIPKRKHKTDFVVTHAGDEIDYHNLSFHTADVDLPFSASSELEEALDWLHMKDGLHELFPQTFVADSNHGSLYYRKAKHHGIPKHILRPYHEVLKTKRWQWHEDYLLSTNRGNVYLTHGRTKIDRLVQSVHCSAVQGHYHGLHSVQFWKTPNSMYNIFGAQTGCLINQESLAFAYGKLSVVRPIMGSLLLTTDGRPQLLTMGLTKSNRWDGKL
jgi:hypothetical protein